MSTTSYDKFEIYEGYHNININYKHKKFDLMTIISNNIENEKVNIIDSNITNYDIYDIVDYDFIGDLF